MAENSAAKNHSVVLRAGSQAAAYPPGVSPILGRPRRCYRDAGHHVGGANNMWSVYILQAVAILLRSEKSSGGSYFDNVKRDNVNWSAKNIQMCLQKMHKK